MNHLDLEKLGLNKNESKVYFAILNKGQATASDLVKFLGVHRNIIYDNLEKLIEKGLVSYHIEGTKRKFVAENPESIVEFLEDKKEGLEREIENARKMLPEIKKILFTNKERQDVSLFKGIKGIKKVLAEVLETNEYWVIGVSNDSVRALSETYWENFNIKRASKKIKENLLINHDFENKVGLKENKLSVHKFLAKELSQPTEIMIFDKKVIILIYTENPVAMVIESEILFDTFRKHFDFLWKLSK